MTFTSKVFVGAILAVAFCGNPSSAADDAPSISADFARSKLAALLLEANTIYLSAKAVIDVNPATEDEVDSLFLKRGKPWGKDERTFQTSLLQMFNAPQMFSRLSPSGSREVEGYPAEVI